MVKRKIFKGQKENERVLEIFRKNWFSFIKPILIFTPAFLISLAVLIWSGSLSNIFVIAGFFLFILAICYLIYNFLLWYWDVYILTDQRVINIDQISLFHRVVSEADLSNIQDTTYEIEGFWRTIMNFGRVVILTASSGQSIDFEDVNNPHEVHDKILRARDERALVMKEDADKMKGEEIDSEKLEATLDA